MTKDLSPEVQRPFMRRAAAIQARIPWSVVSTFFVLLAITSAVHNNRLNQIKGCERSHELRDTPNAQFQRAAEVARREAFKADGKIIDKRTADIYARSATKLEQLAAQDCGELYPGGLFGI